MAKKGISKDLKNKITLFYKRLNKTGIKINSIILFGSHAKGLAKPYSDIDLCIVSPSFEKDELEQAANLRIQANEIDWRIEPHLLTPADLKIRTNPLVHEILSSGVRVL